MGIFLHDHERMSKYSLIYIILLNRVYSNIEGFYKIYTAPCPLHPSQLYNVNAINKRNTVT